MPSPIPSPIKDATATHRGLMGITAQTFAGIKTFLNAIRLGLFSTAGLPVGSEGHLVYDTTTKRPQVHDGTAWIPVAMSVSGEGAASLEEHILSADAHSANNIAYEGGATPWANGTNHTATDVEEAISGIVTSLADSTGAAKVGTDTSGDLSGTNVQEQLNELSDSIIALTGGNWTNLTLETGWTSTPPNTPQYRKDATGRVWLRGTVQRSGGSGTPPGPIVLVLPESIKPEDGKMYQLPVVITGSSVTAALEVMRDEFTPSGRIGIIGTPTLTHVFLDGVSYPTI